MRNSPVCLGDPPELEKVVPSKEAYQTAGRAKCPHLSRAALLEIDFKVTNSTVWALIVNGLLETKVRSSLACRPNNVAYPSHHTVALRSCQDYHR
jgi:hypothetical protein